MSEEAKTEAVMPRLRRSSMDQAMEHMKEIQSINDAGEMMPNPVSWNYTHPDGPGSGPMDKVPLPKINSPNMTKLASPLLKGTSRLSDNLVTEKLQQPTATDSAKQQMGWKDNSNGMSMTGTGMNEGSAAEGVPNPFSFRFRPPK